MTLTSALPAEFHKPVDDALSYLPCSGIMEYKKGQVIYNQHQHSTHLYLIVEGKVRISRLADSGAQLVVDMYLKDEFFGEAALLPDAPHGEQATAIGNTKVMSWTRAQIEELILRRPKLGTALVQLFARRTMDLAQRIESFSADNITRRLARALIRFSERLGVETETGDGSLRLPPLTHEVL